MPIAAGLALLLASATPTPAEPPPMGIASCEAATERPGDLERFRCFQSAVRSRPATWAMVTGHLRSRLKRDPHDATARLALGLLAQDRGDPAAETLLRAAADDMRGARDARGEASAWRALVPLLLNQRRVEEAKEALAATTRAVGASGDPHLRTAVKILEARLALGESSYDGAWALLKEAEPAVFPNGPVWLQADALAAMGATLTGLGRHREALECFRRQLDLAQRQNDRHREADALVNVAHAMSHVAFAITPEVIALTERGLEVAIESGNASAEVSARMALAQDISRPLPRRIEQLERALVVLRRTRDVGQTCFALRELARWLPDLPNGGQTERAFAAADEAIRRAREAGDRFQVARGLLRRWSLAMDYWTRERAVTAGLETLDAIETIRDLQRDEDARARVSSEWVFVYQQVMGFLLTPAQGPPTENDVDRALAVAERLRSQELLGALDAAGSTAARRVSRPEHAARESVLREIVRAQQRLLNVGLEAEDRRGLLSDLDRLEVRERALRDQLAALDPVFASVRARRLATLTEVRGALAPDQALLSFVLCQRKNYRLSFEHPWVFVVTRDSARVVALSGAAADPEASVTGLDGLIGRRDGSEAAGAARLYEILLKQALEPLPASVRRIVIVPDAALHRMPFDALRPQAGSATLGERYEITVAPSASLWIRLRGRPPASGAALLALADPRFEGPSAVSIERQAALWQGLALGQLPRGRREARVALRALNGAGRVLAGEEATERFLKTEDLRRYAVLHIAAHAVVDDDRPERSAIVLAPGAPDEDGLLQAREIVGLDLSGLVVVLSACRSSNGEVLQGEGPLSLARAFLAAGARAVVGNLWDVRDADAEALMAAFYSHLGQGRSVAAALTAARRERLLAGVPTAAWAGTVVLGDGEARLAPASAARRPRDMGWLAVGLAIPIALTPLALWWRRARR